jgi:chromate transporter
MRAGLAGVPSHGVTLNLAVWFALHTWFHEAAPIRAMGLAFDSPLPGSLDPWAPALGVVLHLAGAR